MFFVECFVVMFFFLYFCTVFDINTWNCFEELFTIYTFLELIQPDSCGSELSSRQGESVIKWTSIGRDRNGGR